MNYLNKIFLILIFCLSTLFSVAEAQSINYKAVVKDGSGNLITNDLIQVQFNILQGAALTNVYSESHTPTTDDNGIIIVNIGEGTLVSGSPAYDTIDWASDTHFLQVFINIGAGLVDMGTTEFKAVPYALTSGDKSWESEIDNVHVISKNVGIGTNAPTELLEINDADNAGIKLTVPSLNDISKIEFRNGLETGAHSFYKIQNQNDLLRFEIDSDLSTGTGFDERMTLGNTGLALETGVRVNEFSADGTMAGNSNSAIPTERAVKSYVDNAVSANGEKTIVIPAVAFTSNQALTFVNYVNFGAFAQKTSSNGFLVAPLTLPQGATVTSMTFYLRDGSTGSNVNLECSVLYGFQNSSIFSIVFSTSTFSGSTSGITLTHNSPFTIVSDRQYIVRVMPTSTWGTSDFGICSVKVTYTE
ncbi:hypothetical protein [Lacinutrix chionoecetis]